MNGVVTNKTFRSVFFLVLVFSARLALAEVQVVVKPLTDPITVGSNKLEIQIRDEGKPVGDVVSRLIASMPAMGTMPYMEVLGDVVKKSDGQFVAEVELSMGGTWDLTLTVERGGVKSLCFVILPRRKSPASWTRMAVPSKRR